MLKYLSRCRTDWAWLLSLHMIAFLGFHITVELNGSLWFRRLTFDQNEWLAIAVGEIGFWVWSLGFAVYFLVLSITSKANRPFSALSFLLALVCFIEYRYPVATSLLVLLGQFDRIGYIVLEQAAPMKQVLGVN
ncbi:hypothetical protein K3X41_01190 [Aliiroseovarius crassostreae]|uniref:hypothetical protein n=1 Tax=Aliiroseovarius crassostreae TaxID=154981 RepID=UPI002208B508|nr:hypothetical protein [Aliiroseovarius crassostreae]UWQ08246.1 hypothetical protein K3X25_01190 [Aliiroseovarius crassostreae]UWQ11348.1 hypothetical protein K3X41_01190 [Aliiroseovarius crassostreae]